MESRAARIDLQSLPINTFPVDTLRLSVGDAAVLRTSYQPGAVSVVRHEYLHIDAAGVESLISSGAGFPASFALNDITLSSVGDYVLRLYGLCDSVEIV